MTEAETKHDLFLKRAQITVAILAGLVTLIVGTVNAKKILFPKTEQGGIRILVKDESGRPVAGARLELLRQDSMLSASSETGGDGGYSKDSLLAGSYTLKVIATGYEPQIANLQVNSKQITDLHLFLKPLAGASGGQNKLRSAFEEAGASWIKKLAKTDQAADKQ